MHAPPVWLGFALWIATAVLFWLVIYEPHKRRRVSLGALLVLLTLLAVAFTLGRWKPRGKIEVERSAGVQDASGRLPDGQSRRKITGAR